MKILLMDWPAYGGETIKRILPQLGYEVEVFDFPQDSEEASIGEVLGGKIAEAILKTEAEIVFSFNFFPVIATATYACRRKYVCWVYDSPAVFLYSMAVFLPCNYIFHFDSYEVERMRKEGVEHVYYLPLAANSKEYDVMVPTAEQQKKYQADIAMIGSMYREKYRYFDKYTKFDPYLKGYLDAIVGAQKQVYGCNFLETVLTSPVMERIKKTVPLMEEKGERYDSAEWDFANYYLAMRVTADEREDILQAMSERFDVALYTTGKTPTLPKVRNLGNLDYYTEAPYAMKCAKINLNITVRSIQTGIPLRVLDIMACGGFVLSNYQLDMAEEFMPNEEFVYYESVDDAMEKAAYYLKNEDERKRIAMNGYKKVKEKHDFQSKWEHMISIVMMK